MAKLEKIPKRKFTYLWEESYLAMVKNSVGTKMFRNFFVKDEHGKRLDILNDGDVSCALFVSYILKNFKLISDLHFTVTKVIEDFEQNGWKKVKPSQLKVGDVILWLHYKTRTSHHRHLGFYIGDEQAVSNNSQKRAVIQHHYTYSGKRDIVEVYRPNWKLLK